METPKPLETSNGEVYYTADAEDQAQALDECVAWAIDKYVLCSIIWKEMENDKHVFTVNYFSKIDAPEPAKGGDSNLPESE